MIYTKLIRELKSSLCTTKKVWYVAYILMASLMVFFTLVENKLYAENNIDWSAKYCLSTVLKSIAIGIPVGLFILVASELLRIFFGMHKVAPLAYTDEKEKKAFKRSVGLVGIISFVALVLSRIPAYLAYYPGICTYDTTAQMQQIVGETAYNTHHPLVHTIFVKICLAVGIRGFGSPNAGVAIYTAFQVLALSAAMAFAIAMSYYYLRRKYSVSKKFSIIAVALVTIGMMLLPFNNYLALCMTKDVLFSCFVITFVVSTIWLLDTKDSSVRFGIFDFIFGISVLMMTLLRNNARYAVVVMLLMVILRGIIKKRKYLLKIALTTAVGLLFGVIILTAAEKLLHAEKGDDREMMSIPIQQISRVMVYHGGLGIVDTDDNTVSEEYREFIDQFLPGECYRGYISFLADPVKINTNSSIIKERSKYSMRMYLSLMSQYPEDYVNAFLAVNAGYLSITDVSHAYINQTYVSDGLGYAQTIWNSYVNDYGIYQDSKWATLYYQMEYWATNNKHLDIEGFRYILTPATYTWLMAFFVLYWLRTKKYRYVFIGGFIAAYYLTMLLGPTVQLRYVYPFMLITPFLILMTMGNEYSSDLAEEMKPEDTAKLLLGPTLFFVGATLLGFINKKVVIFVLIAMLVIEIILNIRAKTFTRDKLRNIFSLYDIPVCITLIAFRIAVYIYKYEINDRFEHLVLGLAPVIGYFFAKYYMIRSSSADIVLSKAVETDNSEAIEGKHKENNKLSQAYESNKSFVLSLGLGLMLCSAMSIFSYYYLGTIGVEERDWEMVLIYYDYFRVTVFAFYPIVFIALFGWAIYTFKRNKVWSVIILTTATINAVWFWFVTETRSPMIAFILNVVLFFGIMLVDFLRKRGIKKYVKQLSIGLLVIIAIGVGLVLAFGFNLGGIKDIYLTSVFCRDGAMSSNPRIAMAADCLKNILNYPFGNNHICVYPNYETTHVFWTELAYCGGIITFVAGMCWLLINLKDMVLIGFSRILSLEEKMLLILPFCGVLLYSCTESLRHTNVMVVVILAMLSGLIRGRNLSLRRQK